MIVCFFLFYVNSMERKETTEIIFPSLNFILNKRLFVFEIEQPANIEERIHKFGIRSNNT